MAEEKTDRFTLVPRQTTRVPTAVPQAGSAPAASVAGRGSSHMVERADHRLQTHMAAMQAKGFEGAMAQRQVAGLYAHAIDVQEPVVCYAIDVRDRQTHPDAYAYMAGITDQAIHMMNEDMMLVTRRATDRIVDILDRAAYPDPDTRPWYKKAVLPYPDE